MTNLFATYQTGYDVIGDHATSPEAARESALSYTSRDGRGADNIRNAPIADRPSNVQGAITIVPVSSIED